MTKTGPKPRSLYSRLWSKIDIFDQSGCWIWQAGLNNHGYGQIGAGSRTDGTRTKLFAHRVSYEWFKGAIPAGMDVCHSCDNPRCVNPGHLFLGTRKDNMQDCSRKGRAGRPKGTHCKAGHPFDSSYGCQQTCSICRRAASRRHYRKHRG